jgi:hypothetical protein
MTFDDYLDSRRFPLTTQQGPCIKTQLFMDSFNYDQLREFLEGGNTPDEEQWGIWTELQEKMKHHARLTRQATQVERE